MEFQEFQILEFYSFGIVRDGINARMRVRKNIMRL